MPIISQNLTTPAGLAEGSVASASQITPLYNAMNAFNIPNTIGVWQQVYVDDTTFAIATGASQDWSITTVPKEKAIFGMISFTNTGVAPTYTYRLNGAAVTGAQAMGNNGVGILVFFIGGHDTTNTARPMVVLNIDSAAAGTLRALMPNADLPNVDTTSFGITLGAAGTTATFKYIKIWAEG